MGNYIWLLVVWYFLVVAVWKPIVEKWGSDSFTADLDAVFIATFWPIAVVLAVTAYPIYRVVRWLTHRLAADK